MLNVDQGSIKRHSLIPITLSVLSLVALQIHTLNKHIKGLLHTGKMGSQVIVNMLQMIGVFILNMHFNFEGRRSVTGFITSY